VPEDGQVRPKHRAIDVILMLSQVKRSLNISYKTALFITTAVRTSNPALHFDPLSFYTGITTKR
jgi:hypothetical protein